MPRLLQMPMTALRETSPNALAMWLADMLLATIVSRAAMRSGVQTAGVFAGRAINDAPLHPA